MIYTSKKFDKEIMKISEETWVSGSKNTQFKNDDISFRDRHDEGPNELEVDGLDTYRPTESPTTSLPSMSPSIIPSKQPSLSVSPSQKPSISPTGSIAPTALPSTTHSIFPSTAPSVSPSNIPSAYPSTKPSVSLSPSQNPSISPTGSILPSILPSTRPSKFPSTAPSVSPSIIPSTYPSTTPSVSVSPSQNPSISPTGSIVPSILPSTTPSIFPSTAPSVSPSYIPSIYPTTKPSLYPSTTPSIYPSRNPSHSPSVLDSSTPSTYPSSNPSLFPTSLPSLKPSNLPSVLPSFRPSLSNAPSAFPSALPSLLPSLSPSLPECFVDETGFYGEKVGNSTEVNYFYQVRLVPNTNSSELEDDILNRLENAISRKILPGLFQDTCGKFRRRRMIRRSLQQNKINGVSAQPPDFLFDNLLCQGSTLDCFVVDGRLTIYGDDMNSTETSILVKDKIRDSMQSGELNEGVDERITSVEYLDDITALPNKDIIVGTKNDDGDNGIGRIPLLSMVAAFGVLFLIGGYVLQQKKRRKSEEIDEKEIVTNSDYNDADMEDIDL